MNSSIVLRRVIALAAAAVLPLSLTGCTPADLSASSATAESGSVSADDVPQVDRSGSGNFPAVEGGFGEEPKISAGSGDEPSVISVKTLVEGNGPVVGLDDTLLVNYSGVLWDGTAFDSSFSRGEPTSFSLNQVIKGWKYGLAEQKVGDRVEIVIPAQWGYGEQGAGENIPGGATLVFVVDILGALNPMDDSAVKDAQPVEGALPEGITVEGENGAEPKITVADNASITEKKIIVIAQGQGAKIKSGDQVAVRSVAALQGVTDPSQQPPSAWADPQTGVADNLELVDYTVGSRILVLRPATAQGEQAIVFVADILGVLENTVQMEK